MKRKKYRWGRIIAAISILLLVGFGVTFFTENLFCSSEGWNGFLGTVSSEMERSENELSVEPSKKESSEEPVLESSEESFEESSKESSVESSKQQEESKESSKTSSVSSKPSVSESAGLAGGTSASDWNLILVSAKHPLPDDFSVSLASVGNGHKGDKRVVSSLNAMIAGAKADGITLMVCSSYRTKERSAYLYQKQVDQWLKNGYSQEEAEKEAARWVAPPGTSEHHTGLAFDIVTPSYQKLNHGFANTAAAKWMKAHAHEYGFILRFPEDKQDITGITFEPWHFRYVGKENAKIIFEKGLCLEEYIEMIK